MTTQFDRIYHGLSPEVGKFRIAASGMAWKAEEGEQMVAMQASDIKWAQWIRVARNYQLRVGLKDRSKETFDGFVREDHDRLAHLLKQHFSVVLETKEVSFKGWNWGVTDFQGQDLAFLVSNKTAFELPLTNVANSNIAGRTEVSLEFAPRSAKPSRHGPDEMVEIRFYVPGTHTKERGSDAGSEKSDNEDDGEEISAAQAFHDLVKEKAELGQVSGNIILSFDEVNVLTPRGRYDVDMYPEFLRLRGRTYDYKILYGSISKLFLLPKDDLHVLFILGLNVPIRQGQTRYQYLVMQFNREEEITAELNMAEEEIAKYDRLKKNYEDPTYEVVSGVFRALSKKKIIGAGNFQSRNGLPSVKANLKAVQGDLFLLEKYVFFVSKQPTLIELSDIHQVVFSRLGVSMGATAARTFDVKIVLKSGSDFTFTSLNKEEHEPFNAFLQEKKVKTKTEKMEGDLIMAEDEDEEMQSVASSGEEVPKPRRGGDDDDDSEDDEDFEASESDSGSPTDTDSDDDGGQTASDASGDRDFMKAAKKGKEKGKGKAAPKKAPAKKSRANESDADDDDDKPKKKAAPKPKPKPKAKAKDDDAMDVDEEERPKAKPKPKPKPKAKDDEDGPAKKKLKTKAD